jgi:hypothetical protein
MKPFARTRLWCAALLLGAASLWASAAGAAERGALFKLSNGRHTMYLFGGLPAGTADFYPLEPRLAQALDEASALVVQTDIREQLFQPQAYRDSLMRQPGAATAPLPERLQPRVERVLQRAGLPSHMASTLKPWGVPVVMGFLRGFKQGYRLAFATDIELLQQVGQRKLPVLELENASEQASMLDRLELAQMERLMSDYLADEESGNAAQRWNRLAYAWRVADKAGLMALAVEQDSHDFVQKVLKDKRHALMAAKLTDLIHTRDKIVATVGVLHLYGPGSVPEQLRERGISVEQLY